jgi:hypothetical protein
LPQMIRICIAIPPSGTRQGTSKVTTDIARIARLVQVSADKDYRQWRRFTNKPRNSPGDRQAQHEDYECFGQLTRFPKRVVDTFHTVFILHKRGLWSV